MTARHTDEFRATLADIDETLALLAGAGRDVTGLRMQRAALDDQGEPYRWALAESTVIRSHATTISTLWQHIQSLYITQQEIAMRADEIMIINLSGRGDKDVQQVQRLLDRKSDK